MVSGFELAKRIDGKRIGKRVSINLKTCQGEKLDQISSSSYKIKNIESGMKRLFNLDKKEIRRIAKEFSEK